MIRLLAPAVLAGTLITSVASAQSPQPSASNLVVTQTTNPAGYGFVFPDDPMQAAGFDQTLVRIAVTIHAQRTTLIRPRTAFVVEMLKSVETL
jgi:hypothetical protein